MDDPYQGRREQAYPVLSETQLRRVSALGERRALATGVLLFDIGESNTGFFVILSGAVEITRSLGDREELVIRHGPGEFTGETNMLSARRSLVRGRVAAPGDIVVIERAQLRALVQRDPELSELFMRAFILRHLGLVAQSDANMILLGSRHSAATLKLREFLLRNAHPFTYHDVEADSGVQELLDRFQVTAAEVPVVVCRAGKVLRSPSIEVLATELGLDLALDAGVVRDVVIVGAGPAGLAAAVYAASEGLDALVLETTAPGGQAGTSSRIENYLGFPTGISGEALAGRALTQAEKFGAEVAIARTAVRIDCDRHPYRVFLENGEVVSARALVIATGARYRKPALPELARFEGNGVFYSATHLEAQLCERENVAIVGGGNSAGQAAVFLSAVAAHVRILVRGAGLADSMSRYLIQRIADSPQISLETHTEVEALDGADSLETIRCRHVESGRSETLPIRRLFLMTGADPHTAWLEGCVRLDDKGFIKTGADLSAEELVEARWPLPRPPFLLETSIPGVFAVGDARSGSVKRVASAVGEGSICVQLVHRALQEL